MKKLRLQQVTEAGDVESGSHRSLPNEFRLSDQPRQRASRRRLAEPSKVLSFGDCATGVHSSDMYSCSFRRAVAVLDDGACVETVQHLVSLQFSKRN